MDTRFGQVIQPMAMHRLSQGLQNFKSGSLCSQQRRGEAILSQASVSYWLGGSKFMIRSNVDTSEIGLTFPLLISARVPFRLPPAPGNHDWKQHLGRRCYSDPHHSQDNLKWDLHFSKKKKKTHFLYCTAGRHPNMSRVTSHIWRS